MTVVGIYSFPKSGNTWMRHILAAAFSVAPHQVGTHLPAMHEKPILKVPVKYRGQNYFFYKSHAKSEQVSFEGSKLKNDHIIYIIRHPLDVFLSFVNYLSNNVTSDARSIGILFDYESADALKGSQKLEMLFHSFCVYGTLQPRSVGFGSWFQNAENFVNLSKTDSRVLIIKYEDLLDDFSSTVRKILQKVGHDGTNMHDIVSQSERATQKDGKFYWKRKSGNFREYLTPEQIEQFRVLHGERCAQLKYDI